jgi:hypothetical protein
VGARPFSGAPAAAAVVLGVALLASTAAPSALSAPRFPSVAGTGSPTATPTGTETGTPAPSPTTRPRTVLEPDLIALKASDLAIQRLGDGRRLRFSSSLGNLGPGPLEVRPNDNKPCPPGQHNSTQVLYRDRDRDGAFQRTSDRRLVRRSAGCMVFHANHNHWHFKASARYTLTDPSQEDRVVVSVRRKVSFCLRDTARLPERYGSWDQPLTYANCWRRSHQGITVGWMDIYRSYLAGQALPLPRRLRDGLYCLSIEVDPLNSLREADDTNNGSLRALRIKGDRVSVRPTKRCR